MGVKSSEETIIRENYRGMEKVNLVLLYTFSYNTSRGGHPVGMKGSTLKTDKRKWFFITLMESVEFLCHKTSVNLKA